MVIKNLSFFDNNGYDLNFEWNDTYNAWEGNIYLPKVSVGLYANTNVYVMEKVSVSSESEDSEETTKYCFPQKDSSNNKIMFRWDLVNSFVDEFFMYTFDDTYYGLHLMETSSLEYTPNDGPELETLIVNKFDEYEVELDSDYLNSPLPIHIAFSSPEKYDATTFKRTLNMYYGYTLIARITFFAETIEEDERLKVITGNLGYNIKPEDTIIFKKTDIKECYPNYEILNEKRKELIIEGHNIYPYIGSYKAIINAIKFFGYENLNIIEYWRNVDSTSENFGKLFATSKYSLTNKETITIKNTVIPLPNRNYRKTNEISLVYTLNHPTEDVDYLEIPIVKEDFTYTIEEAIIKLYALRRKLNKDFMPNSSRIVDIIGEGSYFGLGELVNNAVVPDEGTRFDAKKYFFGEIEKYPSKYIHITDNRPYMQYAIEQYWKDTDNENDGSRDVNWNTPINNISGTTIGNLGSICESTFDLIPDIGDYSKMYYYEKYYDRIHVETTDIDTFEPNDHTLLSEEIEPTAKIIIESNSFETILFKDIPDKFGSSYLSGMTFDNIRYKYYGYKYISWTVRFSVDQTDDELSDLGISKTYDTRVFEQTISGDVDEYKKVMFELPYIGYYDVILKFTNTLDDNSDSDSDSDSVSYTFRKDIKVEPYSLDIRGFYYDARDLPDDIKYDMESVTQTVGDISDSDTENSTNEYLDFIERRLIDMTNAATEEHYDDSDLYTSMPYRSSNGTYANLGPYKHLIRNNSWSLIDNINEEIMTLRPNINFARYIKNGVDVKPYTWFLLGFDESKITSVKNIHWKLTNIGSGEYVESEERYFTLMIKKEGDYNIELTLEDSHDNKYTVSRNIIVVDSDANYKLYQLFKTDFEAYYEEKDARNRKLYNEFAKLNTSY